MDERWIWKKDDDYWKVFRPNNQSYKVTLDYIEVEAIQNLINSLRILGLAPSFLFWSFY